MGAWTNGLGRLRDSFDSVNAIDDSSLMPNRRFVLESTKRPKTKGEPLYKKTMLGAIEEVGASKRWCKGEKAATL
ncbi:hypothetical protein FRC12_015479 [Ceratobasidium sp. 428]|nr:hypothetical protein FRC12_015479 [Ceratobasidium sp. 428]